MRAKFLGWAVILLAGGLLVAGGLAGFFIEAQWFAAEGYGVVFQRQITARFVTFLAGFLVSYLGFRLVLVLAAPRNADLDTVGTQRLFGTDLGALESLLRLVALVFSLAVGFWAQSRWLDWLFFLHSEATGKVDPLFGRDVAFYLFRLPALAAVVEGLIVTVGVLLAAAGVLLLAGGHLTYDLRFRLSPRARGMLIGLPALLLLCLAVRGWLSRYETVGTPGALLVGAGFATVTVGLPLRALASAATLVCALLLPWLHLGKLRVACLASGLLALAAWFGRPAAESLVQTLVVAPNELAKEAPYLEWHIQATLAAYGLDRVTVRDYAVQDPEPEFRVSPETVRSIRLWDWRPVKAVYNQLQAIRLYYEFHDVDVDRYVIAGGERQVLVAARELNFSRLAPQAQNWINRHFQFTHGHGLCMSPVDEVTPEGLPHFFIKDIPPESSVDLQIERPEIYFGELTSDPVFVRTELPEFDYPVGDRNATTVYREDRGLPVTGFLQRAALAWVLGNYRILFTGYFTPESRVLLHRRLTERLERLAPFLILDQDPYLVVADGKLFWMVDGYTASNRYPYAEPVPSRENPRFNYLRNAVKITVDAYTGEVRLYLADPTDPIIRVLTRIFPGILHPLEEMPEELRRHIRYPQDLFEVQRQIYARYHMTDPAVFYNQEDAWGIPREIYQGREEWMQSYYLMVRLPGEERAEYVLLSPFTPRNKNNMIAWMAARCDREVYGGLVLYQFPKQQLVYGPLQIEARIDQDPEISQLMTLWGQKGSQVIRGNLLVIPTDGGILYVEPIYLQAERNEIPELTLVVAVLGERVAAGSTLAEALAELGVGAGGAEVSAAPPAAGETPPSREGEHVAPELRSLVEDLLRTYQAAREALQRNDWTAYGAAQERLGRLLEELRRQTGGESAGP